MKIVKFALILSLAGCAATVDRTTNLTGGNVANYTPTVDLVASGRTQEELNIDRSQCLVLAQNKQAQETSAAGQEVAANTLAGVLVGATSGALVAITDSNVNAGNAISTGAGVGLATGLANSITASTAVSQAARQAADECLRGRGYVVL